MFSLTDGQLKRSTVGGTGTTTTSLDRSSSSANMIPDTDDKSDPLTKLAMRKFKFVRETANLPVYVEGQEPINAVVYAPGQQYNSHCDGDCSTRPYQNGKRTASTLVYCTVADKGGATTFTKAGLKVVPSPRDMLLFSHRDSETGTMSEKTEHSGCPVRKGGKWVATQWYREGVSESAGQASPDSQPLLSSWLCMSAAVGPGGSTPPPGCSLSESARQ